MRQRFSIFRNTESEKIVIKEYAELDKGVYSLLCEEAYAVAAVEAALAEGPEHVITLLRTESFFPTSYFTEKLIATLGDYFQSGGSEAAIIEADDTECIKGLTRRVSKEEDDDIEDLLDVADEEVIEEDEILVKLDAPIKIAEDETAEISDAL